MACLVSPAAPPIPPNYVDCLAFTNISLGERRQQRKSHRRTIFCFKSIPPHRQPALRRSPVVSYGWRPNQGPPIPSAILPAVLCPRQPPPAPIFHHLIGREGPACCLPCGSGPAGTHDALADPLVKQLLPHRQRILFAGVHSLVRMAKGKKGGLRSRRGKEGPGTPEPLRESHR